MKILSNQISKRLSDLWNRCNRKYSEYKEVKKRVIHEKQKLAEAEKELKDVEYTQQVLQKIAQGVQESVHQKISAIVSKCLQTIFGEEAHDFEFRFERKRGKTEARPVFLREGKVIEDPMGSASGGQVEVAAFATLVARIVLSNPPVRRLIVEDEPFLALSDKNAKKVKLLLESLSKELDLQLILATHSDSLKAGKVIEL